MKHIVLVEDDEKLATLVQSFLQQNSFNVTVISDGEFAVEQILELQPDLLLLDIMLPNKDGFTICRELKGRFVNPILFLTAKESSIDHVMGLEMGADDYIIKPVDPHVLLARVNLILRKRNEQKETSLNSGLSNHDHQMNFGQLHIDKRSRSVKLNDQSIDLTSHEFELLWLLANHAGEPQSRESIHQTMIGREYDGLDRTVDVRVSRLRKKLQDDNQKPFRIITVWGKGYMFCPDAWDQ